MSTGHYDDDDDDLAPSKAELVAAKKHQEDLASGAVTRPQRGRSSADDILDAVAGHRKAPEGRKAGHCPLCNSPSRKKSGTVGPSVVERQCTNRACRHRWPVGMRGQSMERDPVPVTHTILDSTSVGPEIDENQPFNRRIAEHQRRNDTYEP